jgi:hypothetical protein
LLGCYCLVVDALVCRWCMGCAELVAAVVVVVVVGRCV